MCVWCAEGVFAKFVGAEGAGVWFAVGGVDLCEKMLFVTK